MPNALPYTARQNLLIRAYFAVVAKVGKWERVGVDGASYVRAPDNHTAQGCVDCAFWRVDGTCAVVKGTVEERGLCKLAVIAPRSTAAAPRVGSVGRVRGEWDLR